MAVRLVTSTPRGDHITPSLKSLHWLPISFQVKYKVLVITFKALHGLGPGYLWDRLLCTIRPAYSGLMGGIYFSQLKLG